MGVPSLSSIESQADDDDANENRVRKGKESDELAILEPAHSPAYDASNPFFQGSTTASRRSLQLSHSPSRDSSSPRPKNFLENIASKMRAATEFFHRNPEESPRTSRNSDVPPAPRTLSPKKSVRFRSPSTTSGTPDKDSKSSPIDMPKKAPILPQLDLPETPLDRTFSALGNDSIPTGRPPDTPVLKAMESNGYFTNTLEPAPPADLPKSLQCQLAKSGLSTCLHDTFQNPFDDAAAISDSGKTSQCHQQAHSEASRFSTGSSPTMSVVMSQASSERKLARLRSSSEKTDQTSRTFCDDEEEPVPINRDSQPSGTHTKPGEHNTRVEAESTSPTNPRQMIALPSPEFGLQMEEKLTGTHATTGNHSAWSLESRTQCKTVQEFHSSDSDDCGDIIHHSSGCEIQRQPTHEDIRRKFRKSHSRGIPGIHETSLSSSDSAINCQASISKCAAGSKSNCAVKVSNSNSIICTLLTK
jgi:hypothetical protein